MDFFSLIPTILDVGKKLAAIIPGETDDRIIATAEKFTGVLQDVLPIVRGTDQEVAVNETLDELVARVEAKADRVSAKLRGDGGSAG